MEKGRSLVHSTSDLLKNLANVIVAEGIEDEHQANLLRIYQCDIGQGYYFAKPMPLDEFLEKLRAN